MNETEQTRGMVFNIQKYSVHDGPGVRTLVFLKGCPLRCRWCSNPESMAPRFQIMFSADKCTSCGRCVSSCAAGVHGMRGIPPDRLSHYIDRGALCTGCGGCTARCPAAALRIAGKEMTVAEVVGVVLEDAPFYRNSGGGVTVGGGEPTAQPEFAGAILAEAKSQGLNTALETCGQADWAVLCRFIEQTDLFLYDLKHLSAGRHQRLTGVSNGKILANLSGLFAAGAAVTVRIPLIPGLNDDRELLGETLRFLERAGGRNGSLQGVELLPYHRLGSGKYAQLGLENPMEGIGPYTQEQLEELEHFLLGRDLPVKLVRM